jgi:probable HAF family extracellular repeat protein
MKHLLFVLMVAMTMSIAYADNNYSFRVVDFPGAASTFAIAVNNFGQFVGIEQDSAGANHAIFDDGRQLQLLDPRGLIGTAGQSWAFSINNRDDIAGAYTDSSGVLHGFVRHADGVLSHIDFPGSLDSQAFGVNDLGHVIGLYTDTNHHSHAFELRNGHYRNIDLPGGPSTQTIAFSINDFDEIVGEYVKTTGTNGFGYRQTADGRFTLTTAPGSAPEQTFFISINNRQQILGDFGDATGAQQNFLRTGGDYRPFNVPARLGASFVSAQTLNDFDEIVGYYQDASNVSHGFIATRSAR